MQMRSWCCTGADWSKAPLHHNLQLTCLHHKLCAISNASSFASSDHSTVCLQAGCAVHVLHPHSSRPRPHSHR